MKKKTLKSYRFWKRRIIFLSLIFALLSFLLLAFSRLLAQHSSYTVYFSVVGIFILGGVLFFLLYRFFYIPVVAIEKYLENALPPEYWEKITFSNDIFVDIMQMIQQMNTFVANQYSSALLKNQAEFWALQNQINPHFLYNTLDSIRGAAISEGRREIAEMIEALSSYFRYCISTDEEILTLEEELDNVENYFFIQQYRFEDRLTLIKMYDETDGELMRCLIPKMTLQPLVENAIYHGLEPMLSNGILTIRIQLRGNDLFLVISDNGIGIAPEELASVQQRLNQTETPESAVTLEKLAGKRSRSIALSNVNQRIQMLFGDKYGLSISSTLGLGCDVELALPCITDMNDIQLNKKETA